MEKIINYTVLIMNSLQYIVDGVINLAFQPLFILLQIIQQISELWKSDAENTNDGEAEKTNDYPEVAHVTGFHSSQSEVDQIEEIKKQLNK